MKSSISNNCEKLQELFFLQNENFECSYEFNTGATCNFPKDIDPREIINNFKLHRGKTGAPLDIVEILFIGKDVNNNYQIVENLPANTDYVTQNGGICSYKSVIKKLEYYIINSNSDITSIKVIAELTSLE